MAIAVAGRGSEVVGVYAFFTALATVAVALRVYCRVVLVKNLALDDYFAVCAWVCTTYHYQMYDADADTSTSRCSG